MSFPSLCAQLLPLPLTPPAAALPPRPAAAPVLPAPVLPAPTAPPKSVPALPPPAKVSIIATITILNHY